MYNVFGGQINLNFDLKNFQIFQISGSSDICLCTFWMKKKICNFELLFMRVKISEWAIFINILWVHEYCRLALIAYQVAMRVSGLA